MPNPKAENRIHRSLSSNNTKRVNRKRYWHRILQFTIWMEMKFIFRILSGKSVVLNFWASWCSPCKMEMPDFNEKYLEIGEEVQFLIINMTDGSKRLWKLICCRKNRAILSRYFTIQIRMPLQSTVFIHCLPHILLTLRETQSPRQLVQSTKELCEEST